MLGDLIYQRKDDTEPRYRVEPRSDAAPFLFALGLASGGLFTVIGSVWLLATIVLVPAAAAILSAVGQRSAARSLSLLSQRWAGRASARSSPGISCGASRARSPGSNRASQSPTPALPLIISPGDTRGVTPRFSPSTPGMQSGKLAIRSNDADSSTTEVDLLGLGAFVDLEVEPMTADFGAVDVGKVDWRSISVSNAGNDTLVVDSIELAGANPETFSLGGLPALPSGLGAQESDPFTALFQPQVEEVATAIVRIGSNDPAAPITSVPLSGEGVPPRGVPTAVLRMDVPYGAPHASAIQLRSSASFDPDGFIVARAWSSGHDDETANSSSALYAFPVLPTSAGIVPYVVRLQVTDTQGLEHSTSILALS